VRGSRGRGVEERGARMSVAEMAGVCHPFIGTGRWLVGGEMTSGRWSFTPSVFEAETRGGKVGRHHLGGGK
jgi:hypothetical protein